jgi:adenylate kinase
VIRSERESATIQGSKEVSDPAGSQQFLISGIREIADAGHKRIILDGHFTLLKTGGEIVTIGMDVFVQLGLEMIVVFKDEPKSIYERLQNRDGTKELSLWFESTKMRRSLTGDELHRVSAFNSSFSMRLMPTV